MAETLDPSVYSGPVYTKRPGDFRTFVKQAREIARPTFQVGPVEVEAKVNPLKPSGEVKFTVRF